MGDAVALLLAQEQLTRQRLLVGEVGQHVAQQEPGSLGVAPRLLEELENTVVGAGAAKSHRART